MNNAPIKIMLVDDQNMYLESVKVALEMQTDMKIIGTARNGKEAFEKIPELKPEIILMDISMPELDGIDASKLILETYENQKIILVSTYSNRSYISKAIQLGVSGYVLKDEGLNELIKAIRAIINQGEYYSPVVSKTLSNLYRNKEFLEKNFIHQKLSETEIGILKQWALGKTIKETADILNMSTSTVDKHRLNIKKKLEVITNSDITLLAVREGLIRLEDIPNI